MTGAENRLRTSRGPSCGQHIRDEIPVVAVERQPDKSFIKPRRKRHLVPNQPEDDQVNTALKRDQMRTQAHAWVCQPREDQAEQQSRQEEQNPGTDQLMTPILYLHVYLLQVIRVTFITRTSELRRLRTSVPVT